MIMEKKKKPSGEETKQRRVIKKTRGGIILTEEQVREIKEGRKKLRRQMKKAKVYSKKEFELTASSMGLYFDKNKWWGLFLWLFHGRALAALLGALAALLGVMFLFSLVSQLRGHFTINLGDNMFRNGFVLSEDKEFTNGTSQLYSEPVENVPCISISTIPEDVDQIDGPHNGDNYFAYTFYLRNEGKDAVDYAYELLINSESRSLSEAVWVMLFQDGEMEFFAKANKEGNAEALPAMEDNRRGYREPPLMEQAANPEQQYQVVASNGNNTYYRLLPQTFEGSTVITSGTREGIQSMDVHKYTVVMWLEGDDPDCTDELIGGHLGIEMDFRLLDSEADSEDEGTRNDFWYSLKELRDTVWDSLIFWED